MLNLPGKIQRETFHSQERSIIFSGVSESPEVCWKNVHINYIFINSAWQSCCCAAFHKNEASVLSHMFLKSVKRSLCAPYLLTHLVPELQASVAHRLLAHHLVGVDKYLVTDCYDAPIRELDCCVDGDIKTVNISSQRHITNAAAVLFKPQFLFHTNNRTIKIILKFMCTCSCLDILGEQHQYFLQLRVSTQWKC